MVKGILLDFNGTLFFDSHFHDLAWKAMSKELRGYEMSDEELRDHMHGKNNEKIITYILGKTIDAEENKRYSLRKEEMYRKLCAENPNEFHLAKGVKEFLDELVKNNIPFTIASASIKENIAFFVQGFHLDHWLDPELIVYDDGTYPTKIEMFQEAAKRIDVNVQECMIIEDSVSGINYAHQVHAESIIAINSNNDMARFEQFPFLKYILNDFENFPWNEVKDISR